MKIMPMIAVPMLIFMACEVAGCGHAPGEEDATRSARELGTSTKNLTESALKANKKLIAYYSLEKKDLEKYYLLREQYQHPDPSLQKVTEADLDYYRKELEGVSGFDPDGPVNTKLLATISQNLKDLEESSAKLEKSGGVD